MPGEKQTDGETDMDERAAIPDEETEPEESKEAIRAALREAWTAGTDRKWGPVASGAMDRCPVFSE
jgi:hypothetical protein